GRLNDVRSTSAWLRDGRDRVDAIWPLRDCHRSAIWQRERPRLTRREISTSRSVGPRLKWTAASAISTATAREVRAGLSNALSASRGGGAGSAGTRSSRRWRVDKCPLVVMRASFVQPDGFFLALARHAHDAAGCAGCAEARSDLPRPSSGRLLAASLLL